MANPALTEAIDALADGADLDAGRAATVLLEVMEGRAEDSETAAFLIALRTKGETVEEIVGLAQTMRSLALRVDAGDGLLDTAGTGGGDPTFNVSTTAALVAAAAGCRVAKHGNRSSTSLSGSADLLEALGARIDLEPEAIARCVEELGFGFMFAPLHHAAMKHVVPVRRQLAVRTVFNFLGPLSNPAGATRQLIGVSNRAYVDTIAGALARLGAEHALVVSSDDGLDELSGAAPTLVVEVAGGELRRRTVTPEELGLERSDRGAVATGPPERNAEVTRAVLGGAAGPERTITLMNAGAAIHVGGRADSIDAGVRRATDAIDSGAAADLLERFVARTRELAPQA